jgi:hypothetical protein
MAEPRLEATYILPIRLNAVGEDRSELATYLDWLSDRIEVIVVDGSPAEVFAANDASWRRALHVAPEPALRQLNGKVWGVLTGMVLASHDRIVIADDDVRYDESRLERIVALLEQYEVVRPQNYFDPLPWHALIDSGRSLLNRVTGGDWPGTLGVRRSALPGGRYSGDCLFENLELVRTVKAAGGRELIADDLYVKRLPPSARHFLSQRIRQAYDEFARPGRLLFQLSWVPLQLLLLRLSPRFLLAACLGVQSLSEAGRRRKGADEYFPVLASLAAPLWVFERSLCAWLAVISRVRYGGVRYSGGVLKQAATPEAELRRNVSAREPAAVS